MFSYLTVRHQPAGWQYVRIVAVDDVRAFSGQYPEGTLPEGKERCGLPNPLPVRCPLVNPADADPVALFSQWVAALPVPGDERHLVSVVH